MSESERGGDRRQFVVRGIMALVTARVLNLPAGEYVIHLDTRHPARPRWRIGQPPQEWEHARQDDRQQA